MIKLSNGHIIKYVIASGALAFDGLGWLWERFLVWLGFIKPQLFAVVLKTLTRHPRRGNLRWWAPWRCVALILGGAVNKVGLTNRGFDWWFGHIAPRLNYKKYRLIASIFGDQEELVYMAEKLNRYNFVAVEVNYSCPNADHSSQVDAIVKALEALKRFCRHPLIIKLGVDQDCLVISARLVGVVEAISLNSVKWEIAFPGQQSPLHQLEKQVGGGGGGVSGKPAQVHNWAMVKALADQGSIPVIAPSIMEFDDINHATYGLGAKAWSCGTIHLPSYPPWRKPWTIFTNPCKPTQFVQRLQARERHINRQRLKNYQSQNS